MFNKFFLFLLIMLYSFANALPFTSNNLIYSHTYDGSTTFYFKITIDLPQDTTSTSASNAFLTVSDPSNNWFIDFFAQYSSGDGLIYLQHDRDTFDGNGGGWAGITINPDEATELMLEFQRSEMHIYKLDGSGQTRQIQDGLFFPFASTIEIYASKSGASPTGDYSNFIFSDAVEPPTPPPTPEPTTSPTTASPTISPTTASPTTSPTNSPSNSPTSSPTSNSNTPGPTQSPTFSCACINGGFCDVTNTHCVCDYPYYGTFCDQTATCACNAV